MAPQMGELDMVWRCGLLHEGGVFRASSRVPHTVENWWGLRALRLGGGAVHH